MIWKMCGAILIPNTGGWAAALASSDANANGMDWYERLKKPNWNPPNWVIGCAWTGLYTGMGYSSYMIYKDLGGFTARSIIPMTLYGSQLFLNWLWLPIFFKFHRIGMAFTHLLILDAAATTCTLSFYKINRNTLYFMAPYLCWLTFATCLNWKLWILNKNAKHN